MGTNSKLHVQFREPSVARARVHRQRRYSDRGYQSTWEVTRAQPGASGILVDYTGGDIGASFGSGTPTSRAQQFLAQAEPVLPGHHAGVERQGGGRVLARRTSGRAARTRSGRSASTRAFAGVERERRGTCHFAGEHTSIDFQGYLNGAVESGERVVAEILGDLK